MAAPMRVLGYAKRITDVLPVQLQFTQSLIDYLESKDDTTSVYVWMEFDPTRLIISTTGQGPQDTPVKMKRPSFCPIHNMTTADHIKLPSETLSRGVDVGSAVLVEAADEKMLLIRRAKELRTFPNIWVPPGGHLEQGEEIEEAGLRELQEETGLKVTKDMLEKPISVLALWESSFPPKLSAGMPKRHHIVVYLHCKLKMPHTSEQLQLLLQPDPQEVGAVAWFEGSLVKAIVAASEESPNGTDSGDIPKTFSASEVTQEGKIEEVSIPTSVLLNRAPECREDVERVSTGTKWALENWLSLANMS